MIDIDPKYRLGVDAIDREHAELIHIAEDLRAGLNNGAEELNLASSRIFDRLIHYARTHFGHEEQLMTEAHYPGLPEHHKKHQELMEQVDKFSQQSFSSKEKATLVLNLFLTIWLYEHISKEDAAFAAFLLSKKPR